MLSSAEDNEGRASARRDEKRPLVTTALAPGSALSAADRCDRCGAQAYVRVTLTSGGELLFCAHHSREHAEKLKDIAITIHDETNRLADIPATAPDDEY
jgi:hypothetical protein